VVQGIELEDLLNLKVEPPYKPKVKSDTDTSNFSTEFTKQSAKDTYVEAVEIPPEDDFHNFTYKPRSIIGSK